MAINNEEKKSSSTDEQKIRELEQEKIILGETNKILSKNAEDLSKSKEDLEKKFQDETKKSKELEQEKIILDKISESNEIRATKNYKRMFVLITIIAVCASSAFVAYSYYENQILANTASHVVGNYHSNYVIKNLQGSVVNTWVSWNLVQGQVLHVNIVNDINLPDYKINAIKEAILSNGTVTVDDSLLNEGPQGTSSIRYKGWDGALANLKNDPAAKSYIPQNFDITENSNGAGNIIITLTNDENPDGLSGYTKSVVDGNQILKSEITIFDANQLSALGLGAITRHEFGHALGLAHSTDPADLMHATIQTDYPYISGCDIAAIKGLYEGNERSQVVCQ